MRANQLIHFTKMHGLGNDFVVIDALSQNIKLSAEQVRFIANRHRGIGCDQLLLVEAPKDPTHDFHYRIFNHDGSEVEQCGNGARCFGKFVKDKQLTGKRNLNVSTCAGSIAINVQNNNTISVDMGQPAFSPADIPFLADSDLDVHSLETDSGTHEISVVSMGNPHAVLIVDDVETARVHEIGAQLQSHPNFPQSVNVGFMQIIDKDHIKLRVFERGVGETQACGTGACAAAAIGMRRQLLNRSVNVELLGGKLCIDWPDHDGHLTMSGSASKVFDGKIRL